MRRGVVVPGFLVLVGYAWWATGLRPFTGAAYTSVGIPTVALAIVAIADPGVRPPSANRGPALRSGRPWLVLLVVGAVLEAIGLALGGQSLTVPTLSTVVDHALRRHEVRFLLFLVWLGAGGGPLIHSARPDPGGRG
jgi:hypothetical protein